MYAAFLYTIQSLFLALALPTYLSRGHSESLSRWIFKLRYFMASQLGFVSILAMHVINGKIFHCHLKMKPVIVFCGYGDINQGSSYFISNFNLGSSKPLGVDEDKGKQEYVLFTSCVSSCLGDSLLVNFHQSLAVPGYSQSIDFWPGQCYRLQLVFQRPQELPTDLGTFPAHELQMYLPQTLGNLLVVRLVGSLVFVNVCLLLSCCEP